MFVLLNIAVMHVKSSLPIQGEVLFLFVFVFFLQNKNEWLGSSKLNIIPLSSPVTVCFIEGWFRHVPLTSTLNLSSLLELSVVYKQV